MFLKACLYFNVVFNDPVNQLHFTECESAHLEIKTKKVNIQLQTFGTLWNLNICLPVAIFHDTDFYTDSIYLVIL